MESNLTALEGIHGRLSAEVEALKNDPDRAALEARSLGYLRDGETALILQGRDDRAKAIDSGEVLPFAQPPAVGDATLKEIALGATFAVLAFLCAPRTATGRAESRRRP